MSKTRICLVRHGETAWNAERRLQGQLDIGLNALGLRQAAAAGLHLQSEKISALYASDLARAWCTAESIGQTLGLKVKALPSLRERKYGLFEGLTPIEAEQQHADLFARHAARQPDFAFPGGGESLLQLQERVVQQLLLIESMHAGQNVLLVTHGGVLDVVNRFVRGLPLESPRDFLIPNAGINWLSVQDGQWSIDAWGITSHLARSLDEL